MREIHFALLADLTMALHFAFVVFVIAGGLMVMRWPRIAWIHVPALLWAVWITVRQGICPLTPLEQWLRTKASQVSYDGGFISHYIQPVLYPDGMSYGTKLFLGGLALVLTLLFYWVGFRKPQKAGKLGS